MHKAFVVVALLLHCALSAAQPSPPQLALGLRLAELLHEREMFSAYLKQCVEPKGSPFDPDAEFSANPSTFGGLSPQSAYWPEVEIIYDHFRATACAYATAEKFEHFIAEQFAAQIAEADLRAAISFYESPAGQRLSRASVRVNESFQAYAQLLLVQAYDVARAEYISAMRSLLRKYKNEPR